jgi:hypothetical protein
MEFTSLGATQPVGASPTTQQQPPQGSPRAGATTGLGGVSSPMGITASPGRGSGLRSSPRHASVPSSPIARSEFKGIRTGTVDHLRRTQHSNTHIHSYLISLMVCNRYVDGPFAPTNVAVDMAADPWSSDARISTMPHHGPREYAPCLRWPMFWYPYQVNSKVIRVSSGVAAALCIIGIILRNNRSMQYAIFCLAADYALK